MTEFAGAFASVNFAFNELIGLTKRAVGSVVNFGKQSIKSFSHFQQLESGLQGLMRSTEKGTELFEHLRSLSFDTTFGVDTLASASQQLLGVGIAVEDLDSTLMMIGNVASGDTQKFNELVSVFAKIQNQGKASSIQLQQLALRGVPIYQMLKQMGVEGKATGEDISEAFRRMTSEGGQFENAMERINNTIQGREGFVSDTWREFLTSFAEASGIADIYAKGLDVVYKALQGIVDWLQKINANPVYQAIFRGVLVTMIGAIGSALLLKLIPVIATLIKSIMTLTGVMTAFNATNPFGWVAIGVSAIAGLVVAYQNLKKEAKEYSDIELENNKRNTMEELQKKYNKGKATAIDKYELSTLQIEYWKKQLAGEYGDYGINLNNEDDIAYANIELAKWEKMQKEYRTRASAMMLQEGIKNGTLKTEPKSTGTTSTTTEEGVKTEEKINDLLTERIKLFKKYQDQKQSIENEMALLGLEGEALYKLKFVQEGFTDEQATLLAQEQHKLDLMKEEIEKAKEREEQLKREKELRQQLEGNAKKSLSGLKELYATDGQWGKYAGVSLLEQTSLGSIVNSTMQGFAEGGTAGAITNGLLSVLSQMEGFSELISAVNSILQLLLYPLDFLFGWLAKYIDVSDKLNTEKQKELEQQKELNNQYKALSKAIDEQNQYYLNMRNNLANVTAKRYLETKDVNDMIITPQGNFSTHPDDYIIASKNPAGLGGGGNLNVIVNDYAGVKMETQKEQNGDVTNLIITLSKQVASDYVTGANGWDSAYTSRQKRLAGVSHSR